uniref:Uncharacterized protein n=1 Tax=Lepeophtheirus salmonis TaxID=72036 RepID=A0A0K2VFN5_LEPSM
MIKWEICIFFHNFRYFFDTMYYFEVMHSLRETIRRKRPEYWKKCSYFCFTIQGSGIKLSPTLNLDNL